MKELFSELGWIKEFIKSLWVTRGELREARELWEWHLKYDRRKPFKSVAESCEKTFLEKPMVKLYFDVFSFTYDREKEATSSAKELVKSLLKDSTGSSIESLIDDAVAFSGESRFWHGAPLVGEQLCENFECACVQAFINNYIGSENGLYRLFASMIVSQCLAQCRGISNLEKQKEILEIYSGQLKDPAQVYNFVIGQYLSPSLGLLGKLNSVDLDFIEGSLDLCLSRAGSREQLFRILPRFLHLGWDRLRVNVGKCLRVSISDDLTVVTATLINEICGRIDYSPKDILLSTAELEWIFELVANVPNLENFGNEIEWHLEKLCKKCSFKLDAKTFLAFLKKRIELFKATGSLPQRYDVIPRISFDFFKFVRTYDPEIDDSKQFEDVLNELFALRGEAWPIGHDLPYWVQNLDGRGIRVPDRIVEELGKLTKPLDVPSIIDWARFASEYGEGSESWRKIALSIARLVSQLATVDECESVLWSLANNKLESYSGEYGVLHPRWELAVKKAKEDLDSESDRALKKFYELKLEKAQRDFASEKLQHVEEFTDE
ncbi:hypothetical protein MASR1M31_25570 [Porphyromonadaceae bacterium]